MVVYIQVKFIVSIIDMQKLLLFQDVFTSQTKRAVLLELVNNYSVHENNNLPNVSGITPTITLYTHCDSNKSNQFK